MQSFKMTRAVLQQLVNEQQNKAALLAYNFDLQFRTTKRVVTFLAQAVQLLRYCNSSQTLLCLAVCSLEPILTAPRKRF